MAGEWIKMRTNLWDDPRVASVVEATETSEAAVIGALYWLWATADEHSTTDGILHGMSVFTIDRKTGIKGFGAAMIAIGWLHEHPEGARLARFDEHNGESAKTRAQTAKRVAKHKINAVGNAQVTPVPLPKQNDTVTNALPREDKIRDKEIPHTPQAGLVRKSSSAISLRTYLEQCRVAEAKPIPASDSVFDYADKAGLSKEFLLLHWFEFKDRYTAEGAKRYKSWTATFGKSVRGNWFKLWYASNDGGYALTTVGQQARRIHGEAP
jgi:hypothetical protein